MKFYNSHEDDMLHIWNEAKRNDRVAKKLLNYYRNKNINKKIIKAQSINNCKDIRS